VRPWLYTLSALCCYSTVPTIQASENSKESIIFQATYEVEWKGWRCGEMTSTLHQLSDGTYQYIQDLRSLIFFYPFEQKEQSDFVIDSHTFKSQKYKMERSGMDGKSYLIEFETDSARINDGEVYYKIPITPTAHDKLITQLILIRDVCKNPTSGPRTVTFVEPDGIHVRTYELTVDEKGYRFQSDYGHKSSAFILDPNLQFVPTYFEQFRHGNLVLTGHLINYNFGEKWEHFVFQAKS